jgi:hypothetical protein
MSRFIPSSFVSGGRRGTSVASHMTIPTSGGGERPTSTYNEREEKR